MTLNLVHQTLLSCGYRYTAARELPDNIILNNKDRRVGYYLKDFNTKLGDFTVALKIWKDPHIKLPSAFIIKIPSVLHNKLIPHISIEGILCYIEQMEADWDPNDIPTTYCEVDFQIGQTIDNAILSLSSNADDKRELEGEFSSYWRPMETLFLLSKIDKNNSFKTKLSTSVWPDSSPRLEYISISCEEINQNDIIVKWLKQRYLNENTLNTDEIPTHIINVKPSRLSGTNWPPLSFKKLLEWLAIIDHNARNKVIEKIITYGNKRNIFLFDVFQQDTIAAYIEIDKNHIDLNRYKKNKKRNKKYSILNISEVIGGKNVCIDFKRLDVIKADIDTLLSRNLPRQKIDNLSNKNIALIGCGTVGGYLSDLLIKNGAGSGSGKLDLYDDDNYSPHNFSRHILTMDYFNKNKAKSLEMQLKKSIHLNTNIHGYAEQFPLNISKLCLYDIIIDATGRPPLSKRMAYLLREISLKKRPLVIHAFNDGNGRASKVFVDNGNCCYGCMISNCEKYSNGIDKRFLKLDLDKEKLKSCGSTYTPYDASVSQITASLTQTALLNSLGTEIQWTYYEHILDGSRPYKPQIITRKDNCKICYGK